MKHAVILLSCGYLLLAMQLVLPTEAGDGAIVWSGGAIIWLLIPWAGILPAEDSRHCDRWRLRTGGGLRERSASGDCSGDNCHVDGAPAESAVGDVAEDRSTHRCLQLRVFAAAGDGGDVSDACFGAGDCRARFHRC